MNRYFFISYIFAIVFLIQTLLLRNIEPYNYILFISTGTAINIMAILEGKR